MLRPERREERNTIQLQCSRSTVCLCMTSRLGNQDRDGIVLFSASLRESVVDGSALDDAAECRIEVWPESFSDGRIKAVVDKRRRLILAHEALEVPDFLFQHYSDGDAGLAHPRRATDSVNVGPASHANDTSHKQHTRTHKLSRCQATVSPVSKHCSNEHRHTCVYICACSPYLAKTGAS